jgi:hypothetical protein
MIEATALASSCLSFVLSRSQRPQIALDISERDGDTFPGFGEALAAATLPSDSCLGGLRLGLAVATLAAQDATIGAWGS